MSPLRVLTVVLASAAVAAACAGAGEPAAADPAPYVDARYRPRQEYAFDARPGEEGGRLVVLRTDDLGGGHHAVHVAISGVTVRSPSAPGGVVHELRHVPFTPEALDASGLRLVCEDAPLPEYESGYRQWLDAHGGVFTAPVADVIGSIESGLGG